MFLPRGARLRGLPSVHGIMPELAGDGPAAPDAWGQAAFAAMPYRCAQCPRVAETAKVQSNGSLLGAAPPRQTACVFQFHALYSPRFILRAYQIVTYLPFARGIYKPFPNRYAIPKRGSDKSAREPPWPLRALPDIQDYPTLPHREKLFRGISPPRPGRFAGRCHSCGYTRPVHSGYWPAPAAPNRAKNRTCPSRPSGADRCPAWGG